LKKIVLPICLLLFGARAADASGLYLSGGYSRSNPKFSASTQILESGKTCDPAITSSCTPGTDVWPGFDDNTSGNYVEGWPDSMPTPDPGVNEALEWGDNTPAHLEFSPSNSNSYIYAIGWDFGKTPFRVEIEQAKTDFSAEGYTLRVPQSCSTGNQEVCDNPAIYAGRDWWSFNLTGAQVGSMSVSISSLMLNGYFVLPFFGNIDPYIGVGLGKASFDFTQNGSKGGSKGSENAFQFMLGVEYWIPETGWILGLEYRQSKLSDVPERDNPRDTFSLDQRQIVLKVRYDFITDDF
jgi:opacity protein-like surface antigen